MGEREQTFDEAIKSLLAKGLMAEVAPGEYKLTEDGERMMRQMEQDNRERPRRID